MPIINHDHKDLLFLEKLITHNDGSPLMGEIDMYRRIVKDCENSTITWHFWHDLRLPISIGKQSEIQIDFLLINEKGIFIIEVKGGRIGIDNGIYYYENDSGKSLMKKSPFDQVSDYKYAIINNKIVVTSQVFIETICAFPHSNICHTSENVNSDYKYKLWSRAQHEDSNFSFADFCISVMNEDKKRKYWYRDDLKEEEVRIAINSFAYNYADRCNNPYSESSIQSIIEWLNVDNLSVFNSLQKNDRIIIEGGPGTGKTTIAKAYVNKYHTLNGLYLCWNRLLESKIKFELSKAGLINCKVFQFASFLKKLKKEACQDWSNFVGESDLFENVEKLLKDYRNSKSFKPFDYIIIDEAQDVIDKGAIDVLNFLTSITCNGLVNGKFIVFYDTFQGYKNCDRNIQDKIDLITQYSTHFILDENKRVPTNKEIIKYSNNILEDKNCDLSFDCIKKDNIKTIKILNFDGAKSLIKHILKIKSNIINNKLKWNDFVILSCSSLKRLQAGTESLYDRISTIDGIKELSKDNINNHSGEIPFTSILAYKGLECRHVILILNKREPIDFFEVYIGMTRAIIDLKILILE